jgi:hypothetical protein
MSQPENLVSQDADVLAAYEEMAGDFEAVDPREHYSYMYSKMRSDYTLMEKVGVDGKCKLKVSMRGRIPDEL